MWSEVALLSNNHKYMECGFALVATKVKCNICGIHRINYHGYHSLKLKPDVVMWIQCAMLCASSQWQINMTDCNGGRKSDLA